MPELTRIIHDAPGGLSFKQMANGSIVGTDAPEPPDLPVHAGIRAEPMDFPDKAVRAMHGNRILGKIAAFLPAVRDARLEWLSLGFRPDADRRATRWSAPCPPRRTCTSRSRTAA